MKEVYFNLQKKLLSVRNPKTGLVERHAPHVFLKDVTFKVRESGRQRALREGQKNVHAFVRGQEVESLAVGMKGWRQATYNPYQYASFVDRETKEPVEKARYAVIIGGHINYLP